MVASVTVQQQAPRPRDPGRVTPGHSSLVLTAQTVWKTRLTEARTHAVRSGIDPRAGGPSTEPEMAHDLYAEKHGIV